MNFLDEHPEFAIVSGPMIYFDENGEFRRGKGKGEVRKNDFVDGSPFCHDETHHSHQNISSDHLR